MVTYLMQVELPEYCFLSEAVEWIALGRVPQILQHDDSKHDETIDYRFYWREMPDNFEPSYVYPWFNKLEFDSLGLVMPTDYTSAAEKCFMEFVSELPKSIADNESKEPTIIEDEEGNSFDIWKKMAASDREKLKELGPLQDYVNKVEEPFLHYYEIAWAKMFQALTNGSISCEGIDYERWDRFAGNNDYEGAASFSLIDAMEFSLGFDWKKNEIIIHGKEFVSLRVKTEDILSNSSVLLNKGEVIEVERFGAFYKTKSSSITSIRRKKGRPYGVDWEQLKSHLASLQRNNQLPDSKENCIYELIMFAEGKLGKSPSRSSVQRNLNSELDTIYAQK